MGTAKVRIAKTSFALPTGLTERRTSNAGHLLVFLRQEEGMTFFASVEDIPVKQPDPPRKLPEYEMESDMFYKLTRALQVS